MAGKTASAAPAEPTFDFGGSFAEELIASALTTGGRVSEEDRISGSGASFVIISPVGANSKDALVWNDAVKANVSRAGQFRIKKGSEILDYVPTLYPLVVLDAKTEQAAFDADGNCICRGMSSRGLYDPLCVGGKFQPVGFTCQDCPLWQFRESTTEKPVIHPLTGKVVTKEERCKASLDLYVWNPKLDPNGEELSKVSFSSKSIREWKSFAGKLEDKGVKLWSLWFAVRAKKVAGEKGQADSFVPEFAAGPVGQQLTAEQVAKAEEIRQALLIKLAPGNIIPVKAITAPAEGSTLPVPTVPTKTITADEDVFA